MRKQPYDVCFEADLVYPGGASRDGMTPCVIGKDIRFDSNAMQGFVPSTWQPVIYDAMLVVAAVEVCDHSKTRAKMDWARNIRVGIPVHELARWTDPAVKGPLVRALQLLTSDNWTIEFRQTPEPQPGPAQRGLDFPHHADMIIPFSDGLDSQAVAGILAKERTNEVMVRVRVGASRIKKPSIGEQTNPFENVPFSVKRVLAGNGESSGRSRGFKFGMLSGMAAYLIGAEKVIVPESGQGSLGPVLVNVGQSHFDRRTHPLFTFMISDLLEALFGKRILFEHPMIFGTKGQTLATYRSIFPNHQIWTDTRSCWMDQRHASISGDYRQCGICAACMLRRTSLHAAGYNEHPNKYIWEDLSATKFRDGANSDFEKHNNSQREYAIAGTLHMDHLAALRDMENLDTLVLRQALPLARAMGAEVDQVKKKIINMIEVHAEEWRAFLDDLSPQSFVREWAETL